MEHPKRALLALEDGSLFPGRSFGSQTECGGEVVFNTAMTGYQEVLTDPSYFGQIVVFTTAHIGNYGIHDGMSESQQFCAAGAVTREVCRRPTHPDSVESVPAWLERSDRFGIEGVDTRALTLHIREHGNLRGWLTSDVDDPEAAIEKARSLPKMREVPAVETVTTAGLYEWPSDAREATAASRTTVESDTDGHRPLVVALDYGIKFNILRELTRRGCRVEVVSARAPFDEIAARNPEGILLSNGPGDPESVRDVVPTVQKLIERYPTLAICLGHQLIGLATGCEIVRLPFGHHGANHPVKDLRTGQVAITSQNHNYAIRAESLPEDMDATHVNLNDGTIQGVTHRKLRLWSLQFHPEASPGPHEANVVFDQFVDALRDPEAATSGGMKTAAETATR